MDGEGGWLGIQARAGRVVTSSSSPRWAVGTPLQSRVFGLGPQTYWRNPRHETRKDSKQTSFFQLLNLARDVGGLSERHRAKQNLSPSRRSSKAVRTKIKRGDGTTHHAGAKLMQRSADFCLVGRGMERSRQCMSKCRPSLRTSTCSARHDRASLRARNLAHRACQALCLPADLARSHQSWGRVFLRGHWDTM